MSAPSPPQLDSQTTGNIRPYIYSTSNVYTWDVPTTGVPVSYTLTVTPNPGGSPYTIPGSEKSYTVTGLTNGVDYSAYITATSNSQTSAANYFRTVQPGLLPGPPSTFSATFLTSTTAQVNFTPALSNGGADIKWIVITSQSSSLADPVIRADTFPYLSSIIISGLNSNSQYSFLVQTVNDPGYSPYTSYAYPNGSYVFNGSSYLSLTTNSNLPLGNTSYTIEAWIKTNSYGAANGNYGIAAWGTYGTTNATNVFRLQSTPFNGLNAYWWGQDISASAPTIANGAWHHVVTQFNGVTRSIYVDGVLIGSDTPTGHNVTQYNNLTIGTNNNITTNMYIGSITNLRIVNGVAVYTGNFTVPTSPLRATQPAGTNINAITAGQTSLLLNVYSTIPNIDSSGYGYTMTPVGTPMFSLDSPF